MSYSVVVAGVAQPFVPRLFCCCCCPSSPLPPPFSYSSACSSSSSPTSLRSLLLPPPLPFSPHLFFFVFLVSTSFFVSLFTLFISYSQLPQFYSLFSLIVPETVILTAKCVVVAVVFLLCASSTPLPHVTLLSSCIVHLFVVYFNYVCFVRQSEQYVLDGYDPTKQSFIVLSVVVIITVMTIITVNKNTKEKEEKKYDDDGGGGGGCRGCCYCC